MQLTPLQLSVLRSSACTVHCGRPPMPRAGTPGYSSVRCGSLHTAAACRLRLRLRLPAQPRQLVPRAVQQRPQQATQQMPPLQARHSRHRSHPELLLWRLARCWCCPAAGLAPARSGCMPCWLVRAAVAPMPAARVMQHVHVRQHRCRLPLLALVLPGRGGVQACRGAGRWR